MNRKLHWRPARPTPRRPRDGAFQCQRAAPTDKDSEAAHCEYEYTYLKPASRPGHSESTGALRCPTDSGRQASPRSDNRLRQPSLRLRPPAAATSPCSAPPPASARPPSSVSSSCSPSSSVLPAPPTARDLPSPKAALPCEARLCIHPKSETDVDCRPGSVAADSESSQVDLAQFTSRHDENSSRTRTRSSPGEWQRRDHDDSGNDSNGAGVEDRDKGIPVSFPIYLPE
jgi:hypothetical protein